MSNVKLHSYDRADRDFYPTLEAPRAIDVLADTIHIGGNVLEPAAGDGRLSDAIAALSGVISVTSADIHPMRGDVAHSDLFGPSCGAFDWVISNLPFGCMDDAIRHLLATYPHASHAYLVRWAYLLPAKRRWVIHQNDRFAGAVAFSKRLRWIEGSKGSPSVDYCWAVFHPIGVTAAPFIKFEGGAA